jgi:hypothetical protein
MLKRGPVDVLAFALGAPRFDGSILKELERQTATGTIRVLDAMVLFKTADDECYRVDVEDLAPEDREALRISDSDTWGLFDSDDAEAFWEGMVSDSAIIALAIEHVWAIDLSNALINSGAEIAVNYRVPATVVDEAFASLDAS